MVRQIENHPHLTPVNIGLRRRSADRAEAFGGTLLAEIQKMFARKRLMP